MTSQELHRKCDLGSASLQTLTLGAKDKIVKKINMNIMKDWKVREQTVLDLELNHIVKISSQIEQGQKT